MEKTLVTLGCGCTYNTWDNCTGDNTYCPVHQEELDAQQEAREKDQEIRDLRRALAEEDYKIVRQVEQSTLPAQEYAELLSRRQAMRDRINELEA